MIVLDIDRVSMSRPGKPLFSDLSLTLSTGDRLGVVGLNGAGKSTLLRVVAGEAQPESGVLRFGRDVRSAALMQDPRLPEGTVRDVTGGGWEIESVLDRLGVGALVDSPTGQLSGGQAKRVALAQTLVSHVDLLVLDEPTNHLDIDAIAWLEERLDSFAGALLFVTHDRHLLDRLATRVVEIDRGKVYVHEGGYDAYLEGRALREEREAQSETKRRNLARQELAWLRRGAPARTTKPKAHLESARAVQQSTAQGPARAGALDLHFGTPRLGDVVVELHGVGHRFDDGPQLFSGVDLLLDPRERLGVVGPNGAGKSTLLDIIAGRIQPTDGRMVLGSTAQVSYYDQRGRTLDLDQRVRDVISGGAKDLDWRDKRLMEAFWFDDDTQWAPIGLLSGGERRRFQLLLTLLERPNVLLLDEPTNDLDLDTLRMLEDFLDEWPGALVVVSHDRAFLERAVADVIVLDGQGFAGRRPGGYAAWEDERRAVRRRGRAGPAAPAPSSPTPAPAPAAAAPAASSPAAGDGRSPSTLRHQLRKAQRELEAAHTERDRLTAEIVAQTTSDGGGDHREVARFSAALATTESKVAEAEEHWLDLAAEAESRGLKVDG